MTQEIFTPNVQLSEFALKLRRYRLSNKLEPIEAAALLDISEERIFALEVDNAMPTFLERWRLNRLLTKQKTASPK